MEYLEFLYQIAFAVVFADLAIRLCSMLMAYVASVVATTYERHHLTPRYVMMLGLPLISALLMSFAIATMYSGIAFSFSLHASSPQWLYFVSSLLLVYATIGSRLDLDLESPLDFLTLAFSLVGIGLFWVSPTMLTNVFSKSILGIISWAAGLPLIGWVIGGWAVFQVATAMISLTTSGGIWLVKGSRRVSEWFGGKPVRRKPVVKEECHSRARRLERIP